MIKIMKTAQRLELLAPLTAGSRIAFLVLALFPLLAPYELIFRIQWEHILNPFFALAAFISAGALALSAFLVWAAAAGLNKRISFDRSAGTITYVEYAPVVPKQTRVYPIASIQKLEVETHDWSDSAPSYSLKVIIADQQALSLGSAWSQAEVREIKEQVDSYLGLSAQV